MAKRGTRKSAGTAKRGAKKTPSRRTGTGGAARGAKKSTTRKNTAKKSSARRTRVAPKGDARFVKRTTSGRFKESDDVGRSQKVDRSKRAKKTVKSGYGDQGDRGKRR